MHAQLWCQSLCGKPWCMEWGACWAAWFCCCHDDHHLHNRVLHQQVVGCSSGCLHTITSFALHGRAVSNRGAKLLWSPIFFFFIISKVFFHQSGQSPKIIRAKGVVLERTDSQTVGEFPRGRRKGRYSTLICHRVFEHSPFSDLSQLYPMTLCMLSVSNS